MQTRACAAGSSRRRCSSPKPSTGASARASCSRPSACSTTGSFKIRGALNRLLQLGAEERKRRRRGVLVGQSRAGRRARGALASCSGDDRDAGRCADDQARAHARARRRGRALRSRARGSRGDRARSSRSERGAALVPPFDHPHIIAGQGTLALELARVGTRAATSRSTRSTCRAAAAGSSPAARWRSRPSGRAAPCTPSSRAASRTRGIARGRRAAHRRARRHDAVRRAACADAGRDHVRDQSARARRRARGRRRSRFAPPWPWRRRHLKVVVEPSGAAALAAVLAEPRPIAVVRRRHTVWRQRRRRSAGRRAAGRRHPVREPSAPRNGP